LPKVRTTIQISIKPAAPVAAPNQQQTSLQTPAFSGKIIEFSTINSIEPASPLPGKNIFKKIVDK